MNIGVPSRFACLQVEDEIGASSKNNNGNLKKKCEKPNRKLNGENTKKVQPLKQFQNVSSKKKKNKPTNEKQWEDWKKKDSELVNDNFEQDLQDAIMQSKLDYESKKVVYTELQKQADTEKKSPKEGGGKKKKNKTMSLDAFLGQQQIINAAEETNGNNGCEEDNNFFEKILEDAKIEITKDQMEQLRKERNQNIEEIITISQYQEKLEKEKQKNVLLQEELKRLKTEMTSVKTRNQTLCSILSKGEMKDKADVLIELERLNTVKNELTEEVTRLHGLLEQERSKVASFSSESKHKGDKKHKKH